MAGNTFGQLFRLTTFGESHGESVGGIIDGCPAGLEVDMDFIQRELDRRKPGQSSISTPRNEEDKIKFHSGIFEGLTTGIPIGFSIKNKDHKSSDYSELKKFYRPSHADFTYDKKYGIRDYRGGGRSSARETVSRVVGGAIAKLLLTRDHIELNAFVSQIGTIKLSKEIRKIDFSNTDRSIVKCPDPTISKAMIEHLEKMKHLGDTAGGVITCVIKCPIIGLGEPVFDKLESDLAKAMLSINAVKGFEFGSGFIGAMMKGSEHNDSFIKEDKKITTSTNFSGGIQGGLSNGQDIYFNVAFKPVATLSQSLQLMDKKGNTKEMKKKGRHDVCVVPRAVPIVEAMAALVLADHLLRNRSVKI